tara:strand:+ start:780 stop:1448 length:669 start_codon:yes stop_codon:yes gene_type:complete
MAYVVLSCKKSYWTKIIIKIFNFYIKRNKKIIFKDFNNSLNKILINNKIDFLLNFSDEIFSEKILKKIKYPINFHPGSTKYPGRGCYSWALFKDAKKYGSTSHIMNKKVDSGKIINEINFNISDLETIETLKLKTFFSSTIQFIDILLKIKNNKKISFSNVKWKRKAYKIKDLDKINKVNNEDSAKLKKHKIRSFTYYPFGPVIINKGKKVQVNKKKAKNFI